MGNCLRRQPSTHCGGEHWGLPVPVTSHFASSNTSGDIIKDQVMEMDEESGLLGGNRLLSSTSSSSSRKESKATEVKIKITKKQLEELSMADLKELPVQQVLALLMSFSSNEFQETHPRSWRPNLQSIPE